MVFIKSLRRANPVVHIPIIGHSVVRTGTWAFDSHEVYDVVVMTGMSSTCIVHLFSHFLFSLSFIYFVVANGVWSVWDGYGLLFTLVIGGKRASALIIPVSTHPSRGWYMCHSRGFLALG